MTSIPSVSNHMVEIQVGNHLVRHGDVVLLSGRQAKTQRIAETVGIIYEGRLLTHCPTEELLTGTKRIRAVLTDGCTPGDPPEGTIWQRVQRREWLLTVRGFTPDTLDSLRHNYPVDTVEVIDLGIEDIFKDFVKGRRASA